MALHPLPTGPDEVTEAWLTEALRSYGFECTVSGFRRTPVGEGVGMMALLERFDVEYSDGDGPRSIITKYKATHEANLAVAVHFDIYRREVLFYRDLAHQTKARTPDIYFCDIEGSENFVILMEDLSDYRQGDQIDGCRVADAELCMVEMADLHAAFWNDVDRPELEFAPYHYPTHHSEGMHQAAIGGWDTMVEVFDTAVPDFMRANKERYLAAVPKMQAWIASPPITIVHGDFRMDNLFFGRTGDHATVAALDWQGTLRSKGAQDVAYLLSHSMTIEDRRAHERDLVARWHETLVHEGVRDYSAEQAWEDYRRAVLYLWVYVVVIAGALDATNERGHLWMSHMIRRSAAAIDDLGGMELLAEFERP